MVGGCVAWVKGSGWKSSSDEGIKDKLMPVHTLARAGTEGTFVSMGFLKMLTQICDAGGGVFTALTALAVIQQEMAGAAGTFHHIPSRELNQLPASL